MTRGERKGKKNNSMEKIFGLGKTGGKSALQKNSLDRGGLSWRKKTGGGRKARSRRVETF